METHHVKGVRELYIVDGALHFSLETHHVEVVNKGLYTVDGALHTRKGLQRVKVYVIKAPGVRGPSKKVSSAHTPIIIQQQPSQMIRNF